MYPDQIRSEDEGRLRIKELIDGKMSILVGYMGMLNTLGRERGGQCAKEGFCASYRMQVQKLGPSGTI